MAGLGLAGSPGGDAVRAYTGQDPDAVASRVKNHLARFVDLLTTWMLTPTARGDSFLGALHPAPPDWGSARCQNVT